VKQPARQTDHGGYGEWCFEVNDESRYEENVHSQTEDLFEPVPDGGKDGEGEREQRGVGEAEHQKESADCGLVAPECEGQNDTDRPEGGREGKNDGGPDELPKEGSPGPERDKVCERFHHNRQETGRPQDDRRQQGETVQGKSPK